MLMWVKDNMGTEGHPLCRKGVVVAKAKVAAEADKPKDMTPKDRQNQTSRKQSSASDESEEDSDKGKDKHRKQPSKKARRQSNIKKRPADESGSESFLSRGAPDLALPGVEGSFWTLTVCPRFWIAMCGTAGSF